MVAILFFAIFSVKNSKLSLVYGIFGISVKKSSTNNCIPSCTQECLNKLQFSDLGPVYDSVSELLP